MMNDNDKNLKAAFRGLENSTPSLTGEQKADMLSRILLQCRAEESSKSGRFLRTLTVYPWRAAFAVSAVQAVLGTLIFGTGYTNFILGFFGG